VVKQNAGAEMDLEVQSRIVLAHAGAARHRAWAQDPTISARRDELSKVGVAVRKVR
jgi:hypothetical protein